VVAATTALVRGAPEQPAIAVVQAPPPILERIPHPQRGALMALSVQDHYVEVVTEKGTSLVLMRLSDAIKETGAVAGLQIHRSHWVARDAVKRVIRTDGKVSLELRSGIRLPVSRGYLDAVKAAGLLV
jgi:DNA-binding LytR/AlgR family response regulator